MIIEYLCGDFVEVWLCFCTLNHSINFDYLMNNVIKFNFR